MAKKILFVLAVIMFVIGYQYAYSEETQEYHTDTFSVQAASQWKIIKLKPNYVKIRKDFGNTEYATIMFSSMKDPTSIGKTAKEMRKETMHLVKETDKRFKKFIEGAKLPDLPLIREVQQVLMYFAKVGNTYFVISSMIFVPMEKKTFPIGYMTLTSQENGYRYTIIISTHAKSVDTSSVMLDESLGLVETFKTFQFGQIPA